MGMSNSNPGAKEEESKGWVNGVMFIGLSVIINHIVSVGLSVCRSVGSERRMKEGRQSLVLLFLLVEE
jgi:hypothetical protein